MGKKSYRRSRKISRKPRSSRKSSRKSISSRKTSRKSYRRSRKSRSSRKSSRKLACPLRKSTRSPRKPVIMINPDQIYKKVRTYQDLLQTNLYFFDRKIDQTFYYGGPWGEINSDQGNHSIVSGENLKNLTKKGVFTVDGQSFDCDNDVKQRSYVVFFMTRDKFVSIVDKLQKDERIWIDAIDSNNHRWSNIDWAKIDTFDPRITLTYDGDDPYTTRMKLIDWIDDVEDAMGRGVDSYPNIKSILFGKNMISGIVICKEFCKAPTADAILLEHLN